MSEELVAPIVNLVRKSRRAERAAIVKWLRAFNPIPDTRIQQAANAIERGDHLTPPGEQR